jgi:hypothetical protein
MGQWWLLVDVPRYVVRIQRDVAVHDYLSSRHTYYLSTAHTYASMRHGQCFAIVHYHDTRVRTPEHVHVVVLGASGAPHIL